MEFKLKIKGQRPPPLKPDGSFDANVPANIAGSSFSYEINVSHNTSMAELKNNILKQLGVPDINRTKYNIEMKAGWPLRHLSSSVEKVGELGILANECLQITFTSALVSNQSSNVTTSLSERAARATRAAAVKAREPIAAILKYDEKKKRAEAKEKKAKAKKRLEAKHRAKAKQATSNACAGTMRNQKSQQNKHGGGVEQSITSGMIDKCSGLVEDEKARTVVRRGENKNELSETIMNMMERGFRGGVRAKLWRATLRKSREMQSKLMWSEGAVVSAQFGHFTMDKVPNAREFLAKEVGYVLGEGEADADEHEPTLFIVRYYKGMTHAKMKPEYDNEDDFVTVVVELFEREQLKSFIVEAYQMEVLADFEDMNLPVGRLKSGKDLLLPVPFAHIAHHHFWSLVYHTNRDDNGHEMEYVERLQAIVPELDFNFVTARGRNRQPSEKARETETAD